MIENFVENNEQFFVDFGQILSQYHRDMALVSNMAEEAKDEGSENLARYLQATRENLDLTQAKLAEQTNVPEVVLYALERGLIFSHRIKNEYLHRLADALNEDIEIFELLLDRQIPSLGLAGLPATTKNNFEAAVAYLGSLPKTLLIFGLMILSIFLSAILVDFPNEELLLIPQIDKPNDTTTASMDIGGLESKVNVLFAFLNSIVTPELILLLILILLLLLFWLAVKNGHVPLGIQKVRKGAFMTPLLLICLLTSHSLHAASINIGTGSGIVTSSPSGINCDDDCSEQYDADTVVTLTASAETSSLFEGWSGGGCSGTGSCVVTMDEGKNVTAEFTLEEPAPVADFSNTPQNGTAPLTVTFTDNSTGTITSWLWNLGDGTTSTEKNPSHIYTKSGTYSLSLAVTGPEENSTKNKTNHIIVSHSAPVANFTASSLSGTPPLEVQFTDTSVGNITSWTWDFGDGNISKARYPEHTYSLSGTYTVSLTVSGPGGSDTKREEAYITVNQPTEVNTLILTNRQKVAELYGEAAATQLMSKLGELAAHERVQGLVIQVENEPSVATVYATWDANPTSTEKANAVTSAIKGVIDAKLVSYLRSDKFGFYNEKIIIQSNLTHLVLSRNQLSGSIPAELGSLTNLTGLWLHNNQLSAPIPLTFTNLNSLSTFWFYTNELCEPNRPLFQSWLSGVSDVRSTNVTCPLRVMPNSAVPNAGNVPVIISDFALQEPIAARIGSVELLSVTLESANTLHAVVPVGSLGQGTYNLTVSSAEETLTFTDAFMVEPPVAEKQFLAMVYLACDNNLASSCRRLFNNLELAMINNPDLRIAAFWDGLTSGDSAYYLVQPDDNPYVWASYDESQRVSLGEVDSADPGTLVEFFAWAQSQYPGEYNFLSLVDHGSGSAPDLYPGQMGYQWTDEAGGMFWDDTSENVISTEALAGALDWISDGNALDALYLDACQMSTVEVMAELTPYAQYIVAYENLAWTTYPYDQYFNGLDGNPTPSALAQQIAQVNYHPWPDQGHPGQIAVVKSSQMDETLSKLDALANQLLNGLSNDQVRFTIGEVVSNTAHLDENNDFLIDRQDRTIDLYHFASELQAHDDIPAEVKTAAQELISALNGTIEANYTHSDIPWAGTQAWDLSNLHGLSVYFPLVDEWKRAFYSSEGLPRFANSTAWDDFIQAWYGQTRQRRADPPAPPTEPCPECLIPPMHIALTIDEPESATVGQPVWVPVKLSGVETEDDVRAVQISVQVTDTNILAPADDRKPRLGEFFPEDSYSVAVHSSNGKGWDFILTDVGDLESEAVSGEGIIVELPFYSQTEECVYVEFTKHLLGNHRAEEVNHYQAGKWICTNDRGTLDGRVYLQSRNSGAYDQVQVIITGPRGTYTTKTDVDDGNYTFLNIYQDVYDMSSTRIASVPLFAARSMSNVSVNAGGTTPLDIGLWAGDIDQYGDVDRDDENLLKRATISVDFPNCDINSNSETNIFDLIILQHNNSPQGRAGTLTELTADAANVQRDIVTNDTARYFRLSMNANTEDVLSSIEENYTLVQSYDGCDTLNPWKKFDPNGAPFTNTLKMLDVGIGFWIKMDVARTLELSGTELTSATMLLCTDWNFVSCPSFENREISCIVPVIFNGYSIIYTFDIIDENNEWKTYDPSMLSFINDLNQMKSGFGYWIKANQTIKSIINNLNKSNSTISLTQKRLMDNNQHSDLQAPVTTTQDKPILIDLQKPYLQMIASFLEMRGDILSFQQNPDLMAYKLNSFDAIWLYSAINIFSYIPTVLVTILFTIMGSVIVSDGKAMLSLKK